MNLVARIARRIIGPRSSGAAAEVSAASAATIDLADPRVSADPFPYYERLRGEGPVLFLPRNSAWIILGYEQAKAAFAQPAIFSNAPYSEIDPVLLAADPPAHEPVRRLVARRFTNDLIARLVAFAEAEAARLIAPRVDAVSGYALPLSRRVAAKLIGFDDAALSDILAAIDASMAAPEPVAALVAALDAIAPRASLFPELFGEGGVSESEARSLIRLLWLAATTTTERVMTRCVLGLVENVPLQEKIAADRALLPAFIEEIMRLHPPELMMPRLTRQEASIGGATIPAGMLVHVCVAAANRDPAAFDDPAALRLDRPARRHFAFGSGIHHCVGAPLARRIVATAIGALLDAGHLRALEPLDRLTLFTSLTAHAPLKLAIAIDGAGQ
jgi:cytochrome P450